MEWAPVRHLWNLTPGPRWMIPAIVFFGLLSSLAEGMSITLLAPLLDRLDRGSQGLLTITTAIVGLTLAKAALTYAHSALAARVNADLTHSMRRRVLARMLDLSPAESERYGSGRLVNLVATDTWHTGDALSLTLGILVNACSIAVFSALLLTLSWKLTLLVLAAVVIVSLLLRGIAARARGLGMEGVAANAALSARMIDGLEGMKEIQMFGLAAFWRQVFEAASERVRTTYLRLDLLHRAVPPLSEFLYVALLLGLLLAGVAGEVPVPTMLVFVLILYRMQPQIRQLDSNRLSLAALARSVDDVAAFVATAPAPAIENAQPASRAPRLRFDQVTFAYACDAEPALRGVSLSVPGGLTTAIVGPSGSGKSTLVALLCGFYTPAGGVITVNGEPLESLHISNWRARMAWVSQDAHIFSATILDNIRLGCLDAPVGDVVTAARRADAHAFIESLDNGYDTVVGAGGLQLSSGQRQRLALARAFLRQPSLLILDEATNALDSFSEDVIQNFLRARPLGQTVIVISHRLSSVRYADHAIVLDRGVVVESGLPRDLARQRGIFSRLKELQHVD